MKRRLCFASNSLEEHFRRLVTDCKKEVGGWFLLGWPQDHGISWRKLKKLGLTPLYVIEHIIVAPNHSKRPKAKWSAWDMEKATELAQATARLYGNWRMHFHTHPNPGASGIPSGGDIAFWQAQSGNSRWSFGCIATDRPLRLWPWDVDTRLAASPSATTVTKECGGFLSWRSKILKQARK